MSDHPVCGDGGGRTADGSPCQRRVAEEGERCPQHPREGEPAPAGRPRFELSPEQIQRVEQLAGFGLTQKEVALVLDVSDRTIRRRLRENDEFSSAYARGRSKAKTRAAGRYHQIAFNRAGALGLGEGDNVPIGEQRRALRHMLESDLEYKDRQHIEHSGEVSHDHNHDIDPDRISDALAALAGEAGRSANGDTPDQGGSMELGEGDTGRRDSTPSRMQ